MADLFRFGAKSNTIEQIASKYSLLSVIFFFGSFIFLLAMPQSNALAAAGVAIFTGAMALSGIHFIAGWQLFYGSNIYWRHFGGKKMILRFLAFPLFYTAVYFYVSAWLWQHHYNWKLLVFWLLVAIPNTYHNLGQDRGMITILGETGARKSIVKIRNFLLFIAFPILFFIRLKDLFRNGILTVETQKLIFHALQIGGILLLASLAAITLFSAWRFKKRVVWVYLAAVTDWCAYPILKLFTMGPVGLFSLASTVRHSMIYLALTGKVLRNRGENLFQRIGLFTFLVGAPLGVIFAWAEIKIFSSIFAQSAAGALPVFGLEFFFFTLHGAIALNHFDTEIYAWRFREAGIREQILPAIQN